MRTTQKVGGASALCLMVLATAMSALHAQQLSSPSYRVSGSFEAGSGQSVGPSHRLASGVGQSQATGQAQNDNYRLDSGRQIPEVVQEILRFALQSGWNLKGSSVTSDQAILDIFKGNLGNTIKTGDLFQWDTANGEYLQSTNADALDANYGFWVFSYWGGTGTEFTGTEGSKDALADQLEDGWNLYSPTEYTTLPDNADIVAVWRWNAATEQYLNVAPGQNLVPLEGYWIYKQ